MKNLKDYLLKYSLNGFTDNGIILIIIDNDCSSLKGKYFVNYDDYRKQGMNESPYFNSLQIIDTRLAGEKNSVLIFCKPREF